MSTADWYLVCFVVGLALSALSFLTGSLHLHVHLPVHLHLHVPGHFHLPAGHAPAESESLPFLNFGTVTAFVCWFGGMGYLLARHTQLNPLAKFGCSVTAGLVGAGIVFCFVARWFVRPDENLNPADFEMSGVLGRLSVPIRAGGTGELVYEQTGVRRVCGARAEDGEPLVRDAEVVVLRYEKGIAYVRSWQQVQDELQGTAHGGLR
jgi:membrane protein implicated in regulation of membrane protease activity